MAEEPQTPPSLEEFRAAQAAQAKKVTPPSLEEFRAAQAAQNGQQPPFAQAPSQQQPPQGGSVGAPAGASPSTSAAGGGGAIAAPPAPEYSLPTEEELQAAPRPTIDQLRKEGLELQARSIEQQRERSKVDLASRFADLDLAGVKKVRGDIEQRKEQIADLRTRMEAQRKAIEAAAPTSPEGADMALSEINSYNARISALDDLAYSVQRDEELANQREFNLKAKQGTIPGWLHNEFMQGIGSMAAGTEGFMIEAMARGLPSSLLPASEEEKATMTRDQLAKKWKREILPAMREMPEKAWGSETTPEYMQAARGTWLGSAAGGVTQSIPMMLTPAMSGFFVSGVDGYMRELEKPEFDDIPEAEKLAVAVPGAYVANILERYGFRNLVGNKSALYEVTRAVLGRVPENATIEQAMKVINAETPSAAKNYLSRSVGGFMSEAETGGTQKIADVSIRNLYNTIKGKKVLEEPASWYEFASDVTRSAIEEGIGGKIMAQVPAVSAAMRTSSLGENTDDRHFELVERLLRDKSYEESMARHIDSRVESGDISLEDAERMKADWKAAQNISSRIPEDMSTSRRRRVFDILTEKEKLSRMEPVLVREKIEQLDTKLAKAAGVSAVEEEKGRAAQPTTAVPDTPAPTMEREGAAVQPRQVAPAPKQVFGEKPDKDADVPVWSSLSKGSVLTDSSQPNSHWVVVDDQKSKRSGERIMTLAIVERESDGTWLAGPPSIIVAIGSDGSLRTDTSPRYSYTDADGNRGTAIMQPSSVSIPFGEVIQEDGTTGERFTPQWAKDMSKPKTTPPPQGTIVAGDGGGAGSVAAGTAVAGQRQVIADIATPVIPVPAPPPAGIAPEAIAEIDDVLGITTAAPAAQPEGPVRPEGTGAIPVSERRSKTEPGGKPHMVYVENVSKALSEVAPGIKVFVHATPDAYRAAIEGYNAKHGTKADPAQSTAIYLPASEEVHLSPSADGQGLAHEAAHPIVSALITHRPEVFERLYDEIAADPAMAKMLEFGKLYSDQDAIVQKAESIVRLMDAVASGEVKVSIDPKSAWQRFKRWLQDLLASIGFDTRSIDLSDPKNVREFAASFSDAVANGIRIKKVGGQAQAKSVAPDMRAKVMSGVPLMQRRDPAEVAAVFAKHGMTADAARAYMQQKGIDPGFAQQVVDVMNKPTAQATQVASIAPFYRLKIRDSSDAERVIASPAYKRFTSTLMDLADAMDVKVSAIRPRIGKWGGVMEVSARVEFAAGQRFSTLREYAAIMGAMAPESQDATIVGEFLREDDPNATGFAIRIPTSDPNKAIELAEGSGLYGLDIDTEASEIIIFANNDEDDRQATALARQLRSHGIGSGDVIAQQVRTEFIDQAKRASILRAVQDRLQGPNGQQPGWARLRDLIQLAQERDAAFQRLSGYEPTRALYQERRNRQIELLEKGSDLSDLERKRLESNRKRLTPAISAQFASWQDAYKEAKQEVTKFGDRISREFGGYNIPFHIKDIGRATIKTLDWYMASPTLLGDGARTTIIVDDMSKADAVFDRIREEYYSPREENYTTDLGYPKRLIEVLTANGRLAEFQVMTPEAYLAKDGIEMFPESKRADISRTLSSIQKAIGAEVPSGMGHLFYEVYRDSKMPARIRDAAVEPSLLYYKAFTEPQSMRGRGQELVDAISGFLDALRKESVNEGAWSARHWTKNQGLVDSFNENKKKPERAKRSITKKVVESFPETKKLVTEGMVYYERLPNSVTEADALALMSQHGTDGAMSAVLDRSNGMSHPVRMVLGGAVLARLLEEKRYDDFQAFGEDFATMGTELGQGIQALQVVYGRFWTPAIAVRAAQKAVAKDREKRKRAAKKTIDRLKKGLEQENAEAAEEVAKTASVRKKTSTASSAPTKTFASEVREAVETAKNKTVTAKAAKAAFDAMRGKLYSSVSPEMVVIATYYIERGARTFAEVAKVVAKRLGNKALPYLKGAYIEANKQLGLDDSDVSSDAEIDEYIFKANTDKAVEKLRKAIERKNKKEADAAIAELQQVSKDYGLWGQYREYAIDRLKRMQLQEIKQDIETDPPLREFTDSLVRNLSAQAREAAEEAGLEKPEPKKRRDDIEVIADAFKNFERYKEVWEATRREMQAPYFAAMARAEKAETPEARAEAQDAIQRERAKLERLDNYFGEVGPKPFAESIMAKAVKDGMKALDQKIEEIIKKHYTEYDSAKRSLQTKLVELAGLDGKEAEELASAVGAEFDRIATEKKRRFIRSVLPATDKVARKRKVKAVEDELVALTNAGAFSDDDFIKAYGEKMGWPKLTRENIQEIERLAERVQTSPEGRPRVEAIQDLLGYQQSIPGIDAMEIAQSVWYANMLSGFETQEVNVLANFANMLLEASIATGRMASSKEQRKYLAGLWTSMAEGMATGKLEASAVWRTGYDPIRGQIQVPSTLERHTFKGGAKNPANYLKYVRRFMVAADAIFFEGNRSLRAYQLAVRMASADKKLDPSIDVRNRAAELLGQGNAELEQAKMQAQREYDDEVSAINNSSLGAREKQKALKKAELDRKRRVFELTEKKRPEPIAVGAAQFARRATYNYKPEGTLGAIANFINLGLQSLPAFRYVVPFTNVIANVANETLNYTPVGYIRAARDGRVFVRRDEFTPDQKADAIWKASIGMATMAALYLLSHPTDDDDEPLIEVTANGFGDYRKNEVLREKGWRPYSFRIGKGPYISYQYTPLILAMGFIGNLNDYAKYRKKKVTDGVLNKWSASLGYTSLAFLDMTFLSSMNNVLSAAMDPRNEDLVDDLTRGMAKTARSFVVPNLYTQGAKMVMDLAEIPQKETRGTLMGNLLKDIPVFRAQYQDAVNVLGDPVIPEWGRLASMSSDDPVANFLGDKGISIVAPHPNTLTYTDANGDERMYTDEQKHEFYVRRGQYIRQRIEAEMSGLKDMDKKRLEKKVASITAQATKRAKMGLLGIQ